MSIDDEYRKVRAFHLAFGHPVAQRPVALDLERRRTRERWMAEEIEEWLEADNIVDQVDAMVDLIYFALGSLVELGIPPAAIFGIVHDANMSKLWPDGTPHYFSSGKVQKPAGWTDPYERIAAAVSSVRSVSGSSDATCLADCVAQAVQELSGEPVTADDVIEALGPIRVGDVDDLDVGLAVDPLKIRTFVNQYVASSEVTYTPANTFEEWEFADYLQTALSGRTKVICTFSAGKLFGHDRVELGHAVIVDDTIDSDLIVRDPEQPVGKLDRYSQDNMYWAARFRAGGLLVIRA